MRDEHARVAGRSPVDAQRPRDAAVGRDAVRHARREALRVLQVRRVLRRALADRRRRQATGIASDAVGRSGTGLGLLAALRRRMDGVRAGLTRLARPRFVETRTEAPHGNVQTGPSALATAAVRPVENTLEQRVSDWTRAHAEAAVLKSRGLYHDAFYRFWDLACTAPSITDETIALRQAFTSYERLMGKYLPAEFR